MKILAPFLLLLSIAAASPAGTAATSGTFRLALELDRGDDPLGAALEFRRLALEAEQETDRAAWLWAAAYEYGEAAAWRRSEAMLDRAEEADPDDRVTHIRLLRAEAALAAESSREAEFYYRSVLAGETNAAARAYAGRRLAATLLELERATEAGAVLHEVGADDATIAALEAFAAGRNKRPWLGGLLGLVPGLGYAYSGEYANALRSLILNGLFGFGMAETAEEEQWGAFAAIAFFELTWYSGSIYGGIDAAHRHNRDRLRDCRRQIDGACRIEPDLERLPVVDIRFRF